MYYERGQDKESFNIYQEGKRELKRHSKVEVSAWLLVRETKREPIMVDTASYPRAFRETTTTASGTGSTKRSVVQSAVQL